MTIPDSVRLKLDRAKEHIEAFNAEVEAFTKLNPYGIITEPNADRTEYVFRIDVFREPPPKLGVIVGDCIHNLRSSLDHLAFGLAGFPTGRSRGDIAFPLFFNAPQHGFESATKGMLAGVRKEALAVIGRLQPYDRGDSPLNFWPAPLAVLRELSDIDKHRTLHVVSLNGMKMRIIPPSVMPIEQIMLRGRLEHQAVVARLRFAEPEMYVDIAPTFIIAVTIERPRRDDIPLVPYLNAIYSVISNQVVPELAQFIH